ncbi:LuxR family transcriptional regulator [Sphingomonas oleivorans]|nr:LuxR family transcriptional regulator [Sphingomonas oleivorans]
MSQLEDVDKFIELSRQIREPKELERLVAGITTEMGFDHYALIHHVDLSPMDAERSHMKNGTLVALTDYPEAWVETYIKRNIVANDPVLIASQRSTVGFRWEDVPNLVKLTSAHRAITADTRQAGLENGFTVPAHVPGEANGSCNFAVRTGHPLPERNLRMAQLIGAFAFQAARAMVMNARDMSTYVRRVNLTPRQLECVALAAQGKSDWEIARILGIGEESVKHHFKMARQQYDVPTRIQAAFRAVFDGQLSLNEIVR